MFLEYFVQMGRTLYGIGAVPVKLWWHYKHPTDLVKGRDHSV